MLKLYQRFITKRVAINRFGKLGYRNFTEYVLTDDITPFNKHKRIKFELVERDLVIRNHGFGEFIYVWDEKENESIKLYTNYIEEVENDD